ncbi:DUF296 domain-containing protein [Candidatus Fermentibacteria bacterium]|nr:DUF296 domain-containing protein [Candidatus Fermentibacteria bacterium]
MASAFQGTVSRTIVGRLPIGDDLLEGLQRVCTEKGIKTGRIAAIGAVGRARIGYYDQDEGEYLYNQLDRPLEITMLSGNVSLLDGNTMVHAHLTLADSEGRAYGGHLAAGTEVFACEYFVDVLDDVILRRKPDPETDLSLWDL